MSTKTKSPKSAAITNPAILPIEAATREYADARMALSTRVAEFNRELDRLRQVYLEGIKLHAANTKQKQSALESLIIQNKDLFTEPRTVVFHGVKVGLQKGKGKVEFEDAEKVVERIRAQFPKSQAELLLDVKITPRKEALLTLDAAQLKKLGATITGTGDSVVIKPTDSEVEKLVASILEETLGKKEAA